VFAAINTKLNSFSYTPASQQSHIKTLCTHVYLFLAVSFLYGSFSKLKYLYNISLLICVSNAMRSDLILQGVAKKYPKDFFLQFSQQSLGISKRVSE